MSVRCYARQATILVSAFLASILAVDLSVWADNPTARTSGQRTPRSRVVLPRPASRAPALKNKFNLAQLPKPGPSKTVEAGVSPYDPDLTLRLRNVDITDFGVELHRLKDPSVEVAFEAAAGTHYAVECATLAMSYPASMGYTLQWSSNLPKEKGEPAHAETLNHDTNNVQWIFAAIPKLDIPRRIRVVANGFTSSRYFALCRVTPYD